MQQMEESSTGYNISETILLQGALDIAKLEKTFRQLITRHESLRTSFQVINGEAVQKIHKRGEIKFSIEKYETTHKNGTEKSKERIREHIKTFIRPFDLSRAPLLRVGLIKEADTQTTLPQHILMVDMHHIISDGTSIQVFEKEFMAMYGGEEMAPPGIQYKDYSERQKRNEEGKEQKEQEAYWLEQLAGELPVLELPLDYIRPTHQGYEGDRREFQEGVEETAAINKIAREAGATLYMTLLALFNIFLAKMSGMEDIIVGTPTAGRGHVDLETVIGMFVNTMCMRNKPAGKKRFTDNLREVKNGALAAFENQEYPYEELVEKVDVKRDTSRNPLFDVMFVLQNVEENDITIPGLKQTPYPYENSTSKFDLTLQAIEREGRLDFSLEYSTKLFKEETINRYIGYFKQITASVIKNPAREIYKIEVLPAEEKQQILIEFNKTAVEYPKDKTIDELFCEQEERSPDAIAVTARSYALTYNRLNEKAKQIAAVLRKKGIKPGTVVAIMEERSLEMVIAIFGIIKAGGAYLPISPAYPDERIAFILRDSNTKMLLTRVDQMDKIKIGAETENETKGKGKGKEYVEIQTPDRENCQPRILYLEELLEEKGETPHTGDKCNKKKEKETRKPYPQTQPSNLAYIIYTSGSTGKPKGVLIEHTSVVNLLTALYRKYPFSKTDTYLLKTSYVFDVSVSEIFGWILGGGRMAILEKEGEKSPRKIVAAIATYRVTHINFVPSMFSVFLEELETEKITRLTRLKYIFLAGEALLPSVVERYRRLKLTLATPGLAGVVNIYGPTEA
ncbi:MAG: AMP-binding protein, partial [bacterium]|nr:AMP-binding protein [bacterium]